MALRLNEASGTPEIMEVNRDISERKRAERALMESEERYRVAIESASDGIAIVKGDEHIYVNARFAEMFGYKDANEVIGKPLLQTVHPDDLKMVSEINRMRQMGEPVPVRYEFRGIKKDGSLRSHRGFRSKDPLSGRTGILSLSSGYNGLQEP